MSEPLTEQKNARLRDWARCNRWFLIALVVLLPLTVGLIGFREWSASFGSSPVIPRAVAAGETVGGATWGEATLEEMPMTEGEAPEGARAALLRIQVDPSGDPIECGSPVLHETAGLQRSWDLTRSAGELPDGLEEELRCPEGSTAAFELVVPFILPADAEGPFSIDVEVPELSPQFLRFTASL